MKSPLTTSWMSDWQPKPMIKVKTPIPATIEATSTPQMPSTTAIVTRIVRYLMTERMSEVTVFDFLLLLPNKRRVEEEIKMMRRQTPSEIKVATMWAPAWRHR